MFLNTARRDGIVLFFFEKLNVERFQKFDHLPMRQTGHARPFRPVVPITIELARKATAGAQAR